MITERSTVAATRGVVASDLAGEAVLLDTNSGTYYGLNAVGTSSWELLQVPRPVHEIYHHFLEEYEVEPERCRQDLISLLEDMQEQGLIRVDNGEHLNP